MPDNLIDDTPTIENQAIRAARLVRELLTWADARQALSRAIELLNQWEQEQPHPHDPGAA